MPMILSVRLGQRTRIETSTTLRVDPRLVLGSQLLQLSQMELEQVIDTEINENPALERLQDDHGGAPVPLVRMRKDLF